MEGSQVGIDKGECYWYRRLDGGSRFWLVIKSNGYCSLVCLVKRDVSLITIDLCLRLTITPLVVLKKSVHPEESYAHHDAYCYRALPNFREAIS